MKKLNDIDRQSLVQREDVEQAALFSWAGYSEGKYPELKWFYSIPNGGYRPISVAVAMKETGTKSGVPDTFLPVARGNYHGLYIEMKRVKGGAVSVEQKKWINGLRENGYRVEVCKGFESARDTIINYLEGNA